MYVINQLFRNGVIMTLLIVISNNHTIAQNPAPVYNVPNIIPPTPTAQAFQRYGEIPVDYSTGVPNIEIPLYTVTSRKLSVPLSLSYHASGIKVADMSNDIGLGWSLQGRGMITRTVIDRPDGEIVGIYNEKATYTTAEDFNNAKSAATTHVQKSALSQILQNDIKYRDRQADRYSYQLPGKGGGVYRYDFITGQCVTLPYKAGVDISGNTITDIDGTVYKFEKVIRSSKYQETYNDANTSWYITSIESADRVDKIEYKYTSFVNSYTQTNYFQTARINGTVSPYCNTNYGTVLYNISSGENTYSIGYYNSDEPLLDEIISATTRVKFEYVNDRSDIPADIMGKVAPYRLVSIKIFDKINNTLIKEIGINNNSYFTGSSNNKRLKLNGISIKGNDGQGVQNYTVSYENEYVPPYTSFAQDFWGYYNAAEGNAGLVPSEFAAPGTYVIYGGNRRPNLDAGKICMIKELKYPTGGKTTFEFEPNFNSQGEQVGGFRIKKIISNAENGGTNFITKSYQYEYPYSLSIEADKYKYIQNYFYYWSGVNCGAPFGQILNVSMSFFDNIIQSAPVSPINISNGAPVVYTKVTEYLGTGTDNIGKTEYAYPLPEETDPVYNPRWEGNNYYDRGNYEPRLLSKCSYKKAGTGYQIIASTTNTYTPYNDQEYYMGVNVVKESAEFSGGATAEAGFYNYDICSDCNGTPCDCPGFFPLGYLGYPEYFVYRNTKANTKVYWLTQTEEKLYDENSNVNITNVTVFGYSLLTDGLITSKTTTTSSGESNQTAYKYPLTNLSDNYAVNLASSHIWSPLLVETKYKQGNFLSSAKTYYKSVPGINSTMIQVPDYVETKQGSAPTEARLRYHKYDSYGNVLEASKEKDVHEVYLYGYNSVYPVARVVNTTYDIAKTYITQSTLDNAIGGTDDVAIRNHLSNLRNIPNAFVTTYTYKPLVGMTSETDPNGRTKYYEYDNFNRLVLIRDQDGKILKKICYNYAGQPENCQSPCTDNTPDWQNTSTPPTCQQGPCGNTGYQLQEQKDMNPCSPSYNQTQTINIYNPTACPAGTNVNITSNNLSGISGFTATYTNNSTGQVYTFTVPASTAPTVLGCIPTGVYRLTISKPGNNLYLSFGTGCLYTTTGISATFWKVLVNNSGGCNQVIIDGMAVD